MVKSTFFFYKLDLPNLLNFALGGSQNIIWQEFSVEYTKGRKEKKIRKFDIFCIAFICEITSRFLHFTSHANRIFTADIAELVLWKIKTLKYFVDIKSAHIKDEHISI